MDTKNTTCFLSYAHDDSSMARKLYDELTKAGALVWFDEESIHPGEKWEPAIRKGIRESRFFVALMSSKSISKKGYVQREIREALNVLDEYPDDDIYLIPVRLDECIPSHDKLRELNWVNLFPSIEPGISKLVRFFGLAKPESVAEVKEFLKVNDDLSTFSIVRFNGLYESEIIDDYWSYLRFYDDGTVLSVSSIGSSKDVIKWLTKEKQDVRSSGTFSTVGREIKFSTVSMQGSVDYEGRIEGNKLILKHHSHINGNRGVTEYSFRKVKTT